MRFEISDSPLAQAFGGNFDGIFSGDFQCGGAVEAGGEQFLDEGLDADNAISEWNEAETPYSVPSVAPSWLSVKSA